MIKKSSSGATSHHKDHIHQGSQTQISLGPMLQLTSRGGPLQRTERKCNISENVVFIFDYSHNNTKKQ